MGLALDLEDYHPSVLLHCWLGRLTCKIVSEMTYNVSRGTSNHTIPYTIPFYIELQFKITHSWGLLFLCSRLFRAKLTSLVLVWLCWKKTQITNPCITACVCVCVCGPNVNGKRCGCRAGAACYAWWMFYCRHWLELIKTNNRNNTDGHFVFVAAASLLQRICQTVQPRQFIHLRFFASSPVISIVAFSWQCRTIPGSAPVSF